MPKHPKAEDGPTTSAPEEMYLITVARAVEEGIRPPVPVTEVANQLEVSTASAHQMIKKLAGRGLLDYAPYKGITLTDAGQVVAGRVLRRRRLWAVFLAKCLGLTPGRADEVACDMEHITPADVADRLADFLNDPEVGPRGDRIPLRGATTAAVPLSTVAPHRPATVTGVDGVEGEISFLRVAGIGTGTTVTVLAGVADGDRLIDVAGQRIHLPSDVVALVTVEEKP